MEIRGEEFHFSDLISHYSHQTLPLRFPNGKEYSLAIRYQEPRQFFWNPVFQVLPEIGRLGETVFRCDRGCDDFPELRLPSPHRVRIVNRWKGTWYIFVDDRSHVDNSENQTLFAKSSNNRWVKISRAEFPKEIAIANVDYLLLNQLEMKRDQSKFRFSNSVGWETNKEIWFYLSTGQITHNYSELDEFFPDTEAFPFFLKYIKPHWKFDNPVLDMDFSPYEGLDPGKIPFPNEVSLTPPK